MIKDLWELSSEHTTMILNIKESTSCISYLFEMGQFGLNNGVAPSTPHIYILIIKGIRNQN